MSGKILGAMLGVTVGLLSGHALAALVLGVLGAAGGHLWDALHRAPPEGLGEPRAATREELEADAEADLGSHLCGLFVAVARVDGPVSSEEWGVIREALERAVPGCDPEVLIRRALKSPATPAAVAALGAVCRHALRRDERRGLLERLELLAVSDGPLQPSEAQLLERIARELEVGLPGASTPSGETDRRRVRAGRVPPSAPDPAPESTAGLDPYVILGVTQGATDHEVRRAFRRLASTHHPDKVTHLGRAATDRASDRFRRIREAYEEIRRMRSGG